MGAFEQDIEQRTAVPELAEVTGRVAGEQNRLEGGVYDVYGVRRNTTGTLNERMKGVG